MNTLMNGISRIGVKLAPGTAPLTNLETFLKDVLNISKRIGPIAGIIALVITLVFIAFAGEKKTPQYVKKAILICVIIVLLANVGWIITAVANIVNGIMGSSTMNTPWK